MTLPKVRNLTSPSGNKVANQFLIITKDGQYFQSYETLIVFIPEDSRPIMLDKVAWDYSVTTSKYRNIFLGETRKETEAKIKSGEYKLVDLNN